MEFERNGEKYFDEFAEFASKITPEEWDYFELADDLSDQIYEEMETKGITKAELAKRLGHTRAYVTKVLSGDMNITLKTLAKILHHLEAKAKVKVIDTRHEIMWMGFVTDTRRTPSTQIPTLVTQTHVTVRREPEYEQDAWSKLAA